MKKLSLTCTILILFLIIARLAGFIPFSVSRPLILLLLGLLLLVRGLLARSQELKTWPCWLACAGISLFSFAALLSAQVSTSAHTALVTELLTAPNTHIQEACDADPQKTLSREALSLLFQDQASEDFLTRCLTPNSIARYHQNAVSGGLQISPTQVRLTASDGDEVFRYSALLEIRSSNDAFTLPVEGTLRLNPLAKKISGITQIEDFTIEATSPFPQLFSSLSR